MNRIMIFIDHKNFILSEYIVDIFRIPNVILDHLFSTIGREVELVRTYMFMNKPINHQQEELVESMIRYGFDVQFTINREKSQDKSTDIALACKMVSLAQIDAYDVAVLASGNSDMIPAIKEVRNIGKRVLVTCFEDRTSNLYKEPSIETGPMDFDVFYLDDAIDIITNQAVVGEISPSIVLNEIKNSFFDVNIDYDKIKIKKYITYWVTRARYLQSTELNEEDQECVKKMFDKLNELSSVYKPGYIKALNRNWSPKSWLDEVKRIPRTW